MKPTAEFMSLAAELHSYILSFLPWQDVLRCSSVSKALRLTYMSSSQLQYIVELGGQRLLHVPDTDLDNPISIAKRLQLLRDKANAWFKFDERPLKTFHIPEQFQFSYRFIVSGHYCMWDEEQDLAKIFPILPNPSQRTIEREWSPKSSRSVPNAQTFSVFMDPVQNLVAIAYAITDDDLQSGDESFYIDLRTLDIDGIHPRAAGPKLFLSGLPGGENSELITQSMKLEGLGRHIAFRRFLIVSDEEDSTYEDVWSLQIWDWQHSMTSNSIFVETIKVGSNELIDFCFLGNNRFLVVSNEMKLYSIEDMSQAPQLLARFLLPLSVLSIYCRLPMDDILHSSTLQMQAHEIMWTSDPGHRVLCLAMLPLGVFFVVSTSIFFNLDAFEGIAAPITWGKWGPLNTRVFQYQAPCKVGVCGNRVLLLFHALGSLIPDGFRVPYGKYRLHMMDFSPLAVERRQGLGRVVTEPSTRNKLMTCLPYVEVISDIMPSHYNEPLDISVDRDTIFLLKDDLQLEVIEI